MLHQTLKSLLVDESSLIAVMEFKGRIGKHQWWNRIGRKRRAVDIIAKAIYCVVIAYLSLKSYLEVRLAEQQSQMR